MGGGNAQKSAAARKYALVLFYDVWFRVFDRSYEEVSVWFGYNFVQFITLAKPYVLTEVTITGLKNMKDAGKTPEQR